MTPVAIAGNPHHLPVRPGGWQFNAPLQAAARVVANRHGLTEGWQFLFREQNACIRILQLFLFSIFERIAGGNGT